MTGSQIKTEQEIRERLERERQSAERYRYTYPDVAMYHDLFAKSLEWALGE